MKNLPIFSRICSPQILQNQCPCQCSPNNQSTVRSLKQGNASNDFGSVAEVLHQPALTFSNVLSEVSNHILRTCDMPHSCRKMSFQNPPRIVRAKVCKILSEMSGQLFHCPCCTKRFLTCFWLTLELPWMPTLPRSCMVFARRDVWKEPRCLMNPLPAVCACGPSAWTRLGCSLGRFVSSRSLTVHNLYHG